MQLFMHVIILHTQIAVEIISSLLFWICMSRSPLAICSQLRPQSCWQSNGKARVQELLPLNLCNLCMWSKEQATWEVGSRDEGLRLRAGFIHEENSNEASQQHLSATFRLRGAMLYKNLNSKYPFNGPYNTPLYNPLRIKPKPLEFQPRFGYKPDASN